MKKLKKLFDTEKELRSSEKNLNLLRQKSKRHLTLKKQEQKKLKMPIKHMQPKLKRQNLKIKKLYAEYLKLRNKFVSDYGSYHMSYTESGTTETTFTELLNEIIWSWYI